MTKIEELNKTIIAALADKAEYIHKIVVYMQWYEVLRELGVSRNLENEVAQELQRRGTMFE